MELSERKDYLLQSNRMNSITVKIINLLYNSEGERAGEEGETRGQWLLRRREAIEIQICFARY